MEQLKVNMLVWKFDSIKILIIVLTLIFKSYPQTINPSQGAVYEFGNIGLEQGLSQSTVYAIVQDTQGFMWFGSQDGLNRYDGYSIKIFKHNSADSNTIADDRINCLLSDSKGNLWIGTANGGVDMYDLPEGKFYHHLHSITDSFSISNNNVTALFEDSEGNIWVGTNYGLNLYNWKNNKFRHYFFDVKNSSSLNGNSVTSICEDKNGNLWVGTYKGLFKTKIRTSVKFFRINNLNSNHRYNNGDNVTSLYIDNKGLLWAATYNGSLKLYDKKTGSFKLILNTVKPVKTMYEDSRGDLWLGSAYSGLKMINRNLKIVSQINSIKDYPVNALYESESGILWIGTMFRGVFYYDPRKNRFKNYLRDPQNPNVVLSILQDQSGDLWIGTFGNGLKHYKTKTGKFETFLNDPDNNNSISSNKVTTLYETHDGIIWIGTIGGGLNRYNKLTGIFKHYRQHSPVNNRGLSNNDISYLFEDKGGNLWIGNITGGIDVLNRRTNKFRHYFSEEKNPNTPGSLRSVTSIYEDKNDVIWVSTLAGLKKFDAKKETFVNYRLKKKNLDQNENFESILCLKFIDSVIWIGTARSGLLKYNMNLKSISTYTEKNGLPDNIVNGILVDKSGNLWLSTNKGISRFNPVLKTFKNYDVNDGLQANEFDQGAYFKSRNGEMFFGGVNGFNSFYPGDIKDNKTVPPVYLTSFKVFDKPVNLNMPASYVKRVKLTYFQNFFSFEFVALNFTSPEKNKYAYKLEGFDKGWHIVSSKQRYASYTNLNPGEYILHIRGSNNDGVWNNTGTSLIIIVTPPFWMTWWFRILVIVFILTAFTGVYKYRVNKIRELDRMRLRIASDLHDEVGSDLGGIALIGQRLQKLKDIPQYIDSGIMEINRAAFLTAEKLRDIVWFVNPEHDKSEHLINRLKDLTATLLKEMNYNLSIGENVTFTTVDLEFRRQFYLIFKEILYNIVKHANANKVDIKMERNHQLFKLIVIDDGRGIAGNYEGFLSTDSFEKISDITNGMGLKNIYRRARDINAKVSIQSKPGNGTTVILSTKIP